MNMNTGRSTTDQNPGADPEITAALRAMYAAPGDDGYWSGLEGRIMARLRQAEEQGEWWGVFAEWRTAGLVAAGLMLSLAGAALWKDYQMDADIRKLAAGAAYWTVFDGPTDDVTIAFTVPKTRTAAPSAAERLFFTSEP
jgi:hypothetical protein